jgi:hypothetical protein
MPKDKPKSATGREREGLITALKRDALPATARKALGAGKAASAWVDDEADPDGGHWVGEEVDGGGDDGAAGDGYLPAGVSKRVMAAAREQTTRSAAAGGDKEAEDEADAAKSMKRRVRFQAAGVAAGAGAGGGGGGRSIMREAAATTRKRSGRGAAADSDEEEEEEEIEFDEHDGALAGREGGGVAVRHTTMARTRTCTQPHPTPAVGARRRGVRRRVCGRAAGGSVGR